MWYAAAVVIAILAAVVYACIVVGARYDRDMEDEHHG